jgi:hypothetical protein
MLYPTNQLTGAGKLIQPERSRSLNPVSIIAFADTCEGLFEPISDFLRAPPKFSGGFFFANILKFPMKKSTLDIKLFRFINLLYMF